MCDFKINAHQPVQASLCCKFQGKKKKKAYFWDPASLNLDVQTASGGHVQ